MSVELTDILIIVGAVIGSVILTVSSFFLCLKIFRYSRQTKLPLRKWEPPKPPPPPPPPPDKPRMPTKYKLREKKKKKEYKSRYDIDIDIEADNLSDCSDENEKDDNEMDEQECDTFLSLTKFPILYRILPCIYNKHPPTNKRPDSHPSKRRRIIVEKESKNVSADENNLDGSLEVVENVNNDPKEQTFDIVNNNDENQIIEDKISRKLTDQELADRDKRKAKQAKRIRKIVVKEETIKEEPVLHSVDPMARYNITFPSFGRLRGLPMSLDFLHSIHAKRAYDIVIGRKTKRLKDKKDLVLSGGIDTVAMNSGPDLSIVPKGFRISPHIPELSKALNNEIIMILWEKSMNEWSGEVITGWYRAKVHSFVHRPPYNFVLKYSFDHSGSRKLDGFINTILAPAGEHGYGRRWVWLHSDDIERPETRGSGEVKLSEEEEKALEELNKEYDTFKRQKETSEEISDASFLV